MSHFSITRGLDIPISGAAVIEIHNAPEIRHTALIGEDYPGLKPTMEVNEGDRVLAGQTLFTDKKTPGVRYTSPGCGTVQKINRGKKRAFESLVLSLEGDEAVCFLDTPGKNAATLDPDEIRRILVESGLWTAFRTRPYGKIPAPGSSPAALFVTAMESEPLAANAPLIIEEYGENYRYGLELLRRLLTTDIHYCSDARELLANESIEGVHYWTFSGPHPAGLPSTHIHLIGPVHEARTVWHIGYQDVAAIGALFQTGSLPTERFVALGGPSVQKPVHLRTRAGADLQELCGDRLSPGPTRIISGSVLSCRTADASHGFLGRYHNQVSALPDHNGRSLLNWAMPGTGMFSIKPIFVSAFGKNRLFDMVTALWGGRRAIYPLGTYEEVMPLDIIPVYLLRALAVGDTEKSRDLGCLELVEEDLALCGFSCPGKNEFGPMLRKVLTDIELGM